MEDYAPGNRRLEPFNLLYLLIFFSDYWHNLIKIISAVFMLASCFIENRINETFNKKFGFFHKCFYTCT